MAHLISPLPSPTGTIRYSRGTRWHSTAGYQESAQSFCTVNCDSPTVVGYRIPVSSVSLWVCSTGTILWP
jgi:hypothetical protein